MASDLQIQLDRTAKRPLTEQIFESISRAIESGLLESGTRLPSWKDLASQLGVARGTVKAAYELLNDSQMIETFGAGGTRVAPRLRVATAQRKAARLSSFMKSYEEMKAGPAIFQLGIPAFEGLPEKLFSRARSSNLCMDRRHG
ncbi:GntR family transcriptional regulator [Paraburkholderia nodosa]|uniref:GntR family transcriptional regulator n=1 Tax=Paraburkholderia nodosa TaxID=392320 RepID=UPI0009F50D97|nr:GntR family transcriptional regulator [Paraburkholderia nodosa]